MIMCSRCGQESPQGSLHCVHCGNRLDDDGPARTVLGMPAIKPLGIPAAPAAKPASLLAGLPALRSKTSSPLTGGLGGAGAEGVESPQKTVMGLPLFEGTKKAAEPAEPAEPVDAEAPTMAMQGVTDDQIAAALAEEPAPTVAMQGLTDAQLAPPVEVPAVAPAAAPVPGPAAVEVGAPPAATSTARVAPVQPVKRDDPAHHPQRSDAQARRLGERKGSGLKWIVVALVVAGAAATAWYFLR